MESSLMENCKQGIVKLRIFNDNHNFSKKLAKWVFFFFFSLFSFVYTQANRQESPFSVRVTNGLREYGCVGRAINVH
jgi:hypothetical protein